MSERIREIASEKCVRCETATPYSAKEIKQHLAEFPDWSLVTDSIQKEFRFKSYLSGLEFACNLGKIAESENHHPDMLIGWRRVKVSWSTHAIKGLSQNDFVMAAKSELEYLRKS